LDGSIPSPLREAENQLSGTSPHVAGFFIRSDFPEWAAVWSAVNGATLVGCRTVSGGTATQTNADIGQWVREPALYQIVATPTAAKFYVNGTLVCTHTTNIPTTPLNIYFSTSDGGAGNVPVLIDWVSFERRG
jgi:hypothetical protein